MLCLISLSLVLYSQNQTSKYGIAGKVALELSASIKSSIKSNKASIKLSFIKASLKRHIVVQSGTVVL